MFIATIHIMPKELLLDPAGKAVLTSVQSHLDLKAIEDVRVGKRVTLKIKADSKDEAEKVATDAAERLIVNKIMEEYTMTVEALPA